MSVLAKQILDAVRDRTEVASTDDTHALYRVYEQKPYLGSSTIMLRLNAALQAEIDARTATRLVVKEQALALKEEQERARELAEVVLQRNARLLKLTDELTEARQTIGSMCVTFGEQDSEIEQLQDEMDEQGLQVDALIAEAARLTDVVTTERDLHQATRDVLAEGAQELVKAREEAQGLRHRVFILNQGIDKETFLRAQAEAEVTKVRGMLVDLQTENERLKSTGILGELEAALTKTQVQLGATEDKLESAEFRARRDAADRNAYWDEARAARKYAAQANERAEAYVAAIEVLAPTEAKRVQLLAEDNARLRRAAIMHKRDITAQNDALHRKNLELDALRFVWCDGGCPGGVERYLKDNDARLTVEIVAEAVRNTGRLVAYWRNRLYREDQQDGTIGTPHSKGAAADKTLYEDNKDDRWIPIVQARNIAANYRARMLLAGLDPDGPVRQESPLVTRVRSLLGDKSTIITARGPLTEALDAHNEYVKTGEQLLRHNHPVLPPT